MKHRPSLLDRLACQLAYWHGAGVYRAFLRRLTRARRTERWALGRALRVVRGGAWGQAHGLERVRNLADLRRAVPLQTYESLRSAMERVADGDIRALFSPGVRIHMFATTSGTTARPKYIPVTAEFIVDYRRGWNTFGLKLLHDHPAAILRPILQSSGRYDVGLTRAGIPYGAITGLLARTQKRLVQRYYVGRPEIAHLPDAAARHYVLMRLGAARDVAWAITANPATLITMARVAHDNRERLIRDVHDGTLCRELVDDPWLGAALGPRLAADPARARELDRTVEQTGGLRPADIWNINFVVCWIGGSMGHYRQRLRAWWGDVPIRDPGLLASEGRVTVPFADDSTVGVLDLTAGVFEFIPAAEFDRAQPTTLRHDELQVGHDYAVVVTNTAGLVRYRLDDVVRVHGRLRGAPLLEFLYRGGGVASVAGEKLTENQVAAAAARVWQQVAAAEHDFLLAPRWGDPPYYHLSHTADFPGDLAAAFDRALQEQNEEYASRRASARLGCVRTSRVSPQAWVELDRQLQARRGGTPEQYKRPLLLTQFDADQPLLAGAEAEGPAPAPGRIHSVSQSRIAGPA